MHETTTKLCAKCSTDTPLAGFARNAASPDGRRTICRACVKQVDAQRYKTSVRESLLEKRYGLSEQEYLALLQSQMGACALCRSVKPGGRWGQFSVDHCHDTGRVRGLLCYNCNLALGMLGDTPASIQKVLEYVQP